MHIQLVPLLHRGLSLAVVVICIKSFRANKFPFFIHLFAQAKKRQSISLPSAFSVCHPVLENQWMCDEGNKINPQPSPRQLSPPSVGKQKFVCIAIDFSPPNAVSFSVYLAALWRINESLVSKLVKTISNSVSADRLMVYYILCACIFVTITIRLFLFVWMIQ